MAEASSGGVRIVRPPSDPQNEPVTERFPAPVDAAEEVDTPDPAEILESQSHQDRLNKFLSAKPRTEFDTRTIYIESLGSTIVIRELNQREVDDVFTMFEERLPGRRKKGQSQKSLTEINAHLLAKALVDPDLRDPIIYEKFVEKFGHMGLPEMLMKIIKPLEIINLGDRIMELSGGGEDSVREAKN